NSRAGLFVWLSACLAGRPQTDDLAMLAYLQNRYHADNQTLVVQLVHASFDILTNALLQGKPPATRELLRSFICNKVQTVLAVLAPVMGQVVLDTCLQTAFLSIVIDPIPPISTGSSEATEILRRTRLEFLRACILHGVATEGIVSSVLQENPPSPPKAVKYTRDSLLAQCTTNINRLDSLTGELGNMHGNAGAIASCVVQLINNLCASKDSMGLKTACSILLKRVQYMDVVMQYTQPADFLLPLCMVLKDWTHDQDQAEFLPAYEEFASILLFILAVVHRYDLTSTEIGMADTDFFGFQMLKNVPSSTALSELSSEQSAQLTKWLEGLFPADEQDETGGITDEVMRQCPPQAFYMLVPTLFEQSILACKAGHLSISTFKAGLELLLEPFLLPSLVGGLNWLVSHSWEDHDDADVLLQVLDKLLKPSSSSTETQAMHRQVLVIVAKPLKQSLEQLVRKRPDKSGASSMATFLNAYADSSISKSSTRTELEQWTSPHSTDMGSSLRACIHNLTEWGISVTANPPPRYAANMISAACQILGASEVLRLMAKHLKETPGPNVSAALDVCTAMICAPAIAAQDLREQLTLQAGNTDALLRRNFGEATMLVRLHRSVEAQLAVQQV
ncbi:hypothetical protein BAUCODRAFT_52039, partial [Baudoinia panamericana UAMH 10762]